MAEASLVQKEKEAVPIKEHNVGDFPIFALPTQMRTVRRFSQTKIMYLRGKRSAKVDVFCKAFD